MLRVREFGLMIAVSSSGFAESDSAERALLLGLNGANGNGKKVTTAEEGEKKKEAKEEGLKKVLSSRTQQLERRG